VKIKALIAIFIAMVWVTTPRAGVAADTPPDIQVHTSDSGGFVVTLTSTAITNAPAAQAALISAAQKACAGKIPQFGHYKFDAKAPLDVSAGGDGPKSALKIDQEFTCVDAVAQTTQPPPTDPNWRPSDKDSQAVIDTVTKFFAAKDSGNIAASYALLDGGMGLSFNEWKSTSEDSAAKTGAATAHKVVKLTWYKDPQDAPAPGVYAAADFVDHYEKVTDCGYLSLHRRSDGSFLVVHEQDGFISDQSNMTAAQLAELKTKLGCVGDEPAPAPLAEVQGDAVGYPDVATARKALLARADAQSHLESNGWLVVYIPAEYTIWTFTPETDPAYPAVVRRVITTGADKNTYVNMSVLCQASKAACDNLVRQFNELNEKVKASLKH
jgi:hypothetical protein